MIKLVPALVISWLFLGCTAEAVGPDAVAANLDVAGASQLLGSHAGTIVLDVRTPGEYAEGHLADAVLLDFKSAGFAEGLGELARDRTYLVHCKSGGRSAAAFAQMQEMGFSKLYHLDGGILAWEKAGLPVVK